MEKEIFKLAKQGFQATDVSLDKSAAKTYKNKYPVQVILEKTTPKGNRIELPANAIITISDLVLPEEYAVHSLDFGTYQTFDIDSLKESAMIADAII